VSKAKDLRNLEREYRKERAAILEDDSLSWERKMHRIKALFEEYRQRQEGLEDEQGAA
jgi:lipase chaperone LimK